MSRRYYAVAWAVIFLIAFALRALPIFAGQPYISYVDEGHVLHRVINMISARTWDPNWYRYPSFVMYLIIIGAYIFSTISMLIGCHTFADIMANSFVPSGYYDIIEPSSIIIVGRMVVLLFSIGIVILVAVIAKRLSGHPAGMMASLFAATVPALVIRSSIVIVDTPATFFTTACLYFSLRMHEDNRRSPYAIIAGIMAGFAFSSKYPAGSVYVVVVTTILIRNWSLLEKGHALLSSVIGLVLGALIAMPTLLSRFNTVLMDIRLQASVYRHSSTLLSYWDQALSKAELGPVFLIFALIGIGILFTRRLTRTVAISWIAFAVVLIGWLTRSRYQHFRNLLPLVPIGCITIGIFWGKLFEFSRRLRPVTVVVAIGVVVAMTMGPAYSYIQRQLRLEDTRVQSVKWMAENVSREDRVLIIEEQTFLPSHLQQLKCHINIIPLWKTREFLKQNQDIGYVVTGEFDVPPVDNSGKSVNLDAWSEYLEELDIQIKFGTRHTPSLLITWRSNDQLIKIFKVPQR